MILFLDVLKHDPQHRRRSKTLINEMKVELFFSSAQTVNQRCFYSQIGISDRNFTPVVFNLITLSANKSRDIGT